jgi:hypothetical protein
MLALSSSHDNITVANQHQPSWASAMLEMPFLCPQSLGDDEVICLWHPSSSILLTKLPLATMLLHLSVLAMGLLTGPHMRAAAAPEALLHEHQQVPMVKEACVTYDHPNPLWEMYPNNATGVLNTTLAIVPITMREARRIIPSQFGILDDALREAMPGFPAGMYPVLVQAGHDHDIRFQNYTIADFSVSGQRRRRACRDLRAGGRVATAAPIANSHTSERVSSSHSSTSSAMDTAPSVGSPNNSSRTRTTTPSWAPARTAPRSTPAATAAAATPTKRTPSGPARPFSTARAGRSRASCT